MTTSFRLICSIAFIGLIFSSCQNKKEENKIAFSSLSEVEKRSPENAISSMEVAEGLKLKLFASEPMIANPTNMAIDAKGRIWICEGRNYRNSRNPDNAYDPAGDRIVILEDTDNDGVADRSKVFYQGEDINAALGIVVLGNKVIVSKSPNVFVFTDENGDDIPDSKEILYTGLDGEDHDHGAHAFIFGPDGRLYFNYGNEAHRLTNTAGDTIVDIHGRKVNNSGKPFMEGLALRSELDGSNVEVLGYNFRNPYELAIDSYGGLWQSDNDDDGNRAARINYLMEQGNYGFKDKITKANWRIRRAGWNDSIPLRHWHLNDPGTVPNLLQTGAGSPCGMVFYEGNLLPEVFQNQMIHAEPGHNVVHSYSVKDDGAGYTAVINNLIKSEDDWFRPDDVTAAPDGSLFISDWYDGGVGGHKVEDINRGRIYQVSTLDNYTIPKLDLNSGEGAMEGLLSSNMDVFYQSWQKLHSMGAAAEPLLLKLIEKGGIAKARALWLGAKIPGKGAEYINLALSDDAVSFRMQGIRMAKYVHVEKITTFVAKVVNDPSAQVRREAVIALKFVGTREAANLWANLAMQHKVGDRWALEALGIGADKHQDMYFNTWKSKVGDAWNTAAGKEIVWRVNATATVPLLLDMIKDKNVLTNKIASYSRAFHFKKHPQKNELLLSLLNIDHPQIKMIQSYALGELDVDFVINSPKNMQSVQKILPVIEGTAEWLTALKKYSIKGQEKAIFSLITSKAAIDLRKEATALLFNNYSSKTVVDFLASDTTDAGKIELLDILGSVTNDKAVDFLENSLLENAFSAPLMRKVVASLGNTGNGQKKLYELLKNGKLKEEYRTTAVLKLMTSWNTEISTYAQNYLNTSAADKTDIATLIQKVGDAKAGKLVYATYCASCHIADGTGIDFGPGLSDIGNKLSKRFLYSSIIYPTAGINFGYEGYTIKLKDNSTLMGYKLGETENEITLKMMGATLKEVPVKEIESMTAMDKSLMPEGLDKVMSEADLVNLVSYLETLKIVN